MQQNIFESIIDLLKRDEINSKKKTINLLTNATLE